MVDLQEDRRIDRPARRRWLLTGAALAVPGWAVVAPLSTARAAGPGDELERALRAGGGRTAGRVEGRVDGNSAGRVLMLRHALAPGTFDPPEFRLGDCSTQRNLSDEGRAQARQIGTWFAQRRLRPVRVRSSPWCRCVDTARLAFEPAGADGSKVETWSALGSPHGLDAPAKAQAMAQLRDGLREAVRREQGFEVWVTHNFVFSALLGESTDVGEGVLLGLDAAGAPRIVTRVASRAFVSTDAPAPKVTTG